MGLTADCLPVEAAYWIQGTDRDVSNVCECTVTDMDLLSDQTDDASPAGFVDQLRKGPAQINTSTRTAYLREIYGCEKANPDDKIKANRQKTLAQINNSSAQARSYPYYS